MLIIGCRPELCKRYTMMIWPLCRLCSIANKVSEVNEVGPVETEAGTGNGVGAEAGAGKDEAGADGDGAKEAGAIMEGVADGGISEDGRVSDLFPLALRGPLKVTVRSSRFQQFFFTYAKLMAGLRLSRVLESEVTPLALHKAVIKVGNPSLEESCWAIVSRSI